MPNEVIKVDDVAQAKKIMKIMDAIEELEDVVNTFSNFDIDESVDLS